MKKKTIGSVICTLVSFVRLHFLSCELSCLLLFLIVVKAQSLNFESNLTSGSIEMTRDMVKNDVFLQVCDLGN